MTPSFNRPVHFEIHADDLQRAQAFYKEIFGWEFTKWDDPSAGMEYWMIKTGEEGTMGINGGMHPRMGGKDGSCVHAYVCTIGVEDLDGKIKMIEERGGEQVVETKKITGMGNLAYCTDTEGNIFGMMEMAQK